MKAPTGSGKTIILIDYVDKYLTNISGNMAFIWLCPSKGNLEEQSREKMRRFSPGRATQNLFDSLQSGFAPGSTTFINWELVTKKGNTAIRNSERKNLFDRIADAHRSGLEFIVIIDEEHSNNTAKARTIIDAFAARNIICVSATAIENKRYDFFEIDEVDVISAGLITKALYVNEELSDNIEITDDYDYLLGLADEKRNAIAARYQSISKNIRPLVLIQFPNGQPETIAAVEKKLETMGYTYDNGMVSKWMRDDLLDFCYVYTFDEKYKAGLLADMDKAHETRRLFLKDKCKTFTLEKEIRDQDFDGLGEREVLNRIHEALVKKHGLSTDKANNKIRLMADGYTFGNEIIGHALYGRYIRTDKVAESTSYYTTRKCVDTHKHGMEMLHCVDSIKRTIGMPTAKVKTILERLFRKGGNTAKKLLLLDTAEFYAFIINNEHLLKEEFREVTADMAVQMSLLLHPKKSTFHIPEQDFFKYDPGVKSEVEYLSSAYREYTSGYATSLVRSTSEMLFEQYCEKQEDIEWVYKNGDTGQQYFSIVYIDTLQHQWLFYADYIVMKKDGTVWIIETKGGESHGQDKNIDKQIENKFNAFKIYAAEKDLHWGFVRDKDNQLYINNTEFALDMSSESWKPLETVF